jgi:acyl-coenzyme A thioesterase 13
VTTHPPAADTPEGFVPLFRTGPLLDTLGPFFCRPRKSSFVIGLRIAAKHAPGGLLLTLVDIALGYTASASSDPPLALRTVDIAADFATVLPRGILNIG